MHIIEEEIALNKQEQANTKNYDQNYIEKLYEIQK